MGEILGNNLIIYIRDAGGTYYPVACDKSCTISLSRSMMNVTGPGSGKWKRILPAAGIEGTVSGDGMVNFNAHTSAAELQKKLIQGTLIRMMCEIDTGNGMVLYEMNGYVESIDITGAVNDFCTFTYSIPIDGEIRITDEAGKEEEVGIQNLLLLFPGGEPLDIDNNENKLII